LINAENAQEEDLLKAKAIFDGLYSANNAYLGALINSADVSFRLTKLDEAKVLYLSVLEKIEDQKTNNNTSGQALSEHINTFSLHAYNQLGLIERHQGRFEEAEHFYKQALDLNNKHPVTLKNLAILLDLYRGKLKEALALYEQYQGIVGDSDPKIKDWVFDLKNRIPQEEASNE
jgi:tetratricopeptide (TPR) repeat protein